jgi:hypothetical protein
MDGIGEKTSLYIIADRHNGVLGQVIAGFIGFGTLHIHTTRLEPWQWYDQVQHITNAPTFL